MIEYTISKNKHIAKNKRDFVSDIEKFIKNESYLDGSILVLYGLRRTGKTTAMEQVITECIAPNEYAFLEMENGDNMYDLKQKIIEEIEKGKTLICVDEITKTEGFIENSATLPDIFAKEGIRIIVTGTDSLGFVFAENHELFDRTIDINTTHISFAEHCRVLETKDIDDYICFGGLMRKGMNRDKDGIYNYESMCKYIDSAVAGNISHSIKMNSDTTPLEKLSKNEISTIIEKMVEKYSGKINIKIVQDELNKVSINEPINKLIGRVEKEIINRIVYEERTIVKEFLKEIGANTKITTPITEEMIQSLENYLRDMDVLSVTPITSFRYTELEGWKEEPTTHEYYIVQPAIKYYHLEQGMKFIDTQRFYSELSTDDKNFLKQKLREKIMGDMTEQIVLFDVKKDLMPKESSTLSFQKYFVTKPVFYNDKKNIGEYDMLIRDNEQKKYWGFEIKHTTNPYYEQEEHLINNKLQTIIDKQYGNRENVAVLYRGNPFLSDTGTYYLNLTDFMLAVNKYKDMEKVFAEITRNLSVINLKKLSELEEKFSDKNIPLEKQLRIGKEITEIKNQINGKREVLNREEIAH